jgi:hypothetical protein
MPDSPPFTLSQLVELSDRLQYARTAPQGFAADELRGPPRDAAYAITLAAREARIAPRVPARPSRPPTPAAERGLEARDAEDEARGMPDAGSFA